MMPIFRDKCCINYMRNLSFSGQGKFGSSSALGSGCITHTHGSHKAFSGQGHSLRSAAVNETRMPADLPMTSHKHEARRLHNFCDPAHAQESIEEVPEVDNSDLKEELACGAEPGKAQVSPLSAFLFKFTKYQDFVQAQLSPFACFSHVLMCLCQINKST